MKKVFLILIIAAGTLISCDDTEPVVFDGSQTLVYFPENSANLDVVIDDTGSLDVQINTTSLSDQDRTVDIEIVEGDETTVDFENIDIPSLSTTIPAGEFFGFLTINGIDNSVETSPELLTLRITDAGDATVDPSTIEVRVRQICPIEEGFFTGPYLLEQVTPIHPENGILTFETQIVDIVQGSGSTERSFDVNYLEGFDIGQPDMTLPFDLSCNDVVILGDNVIDSNLGCNNDQGTDDPDDDVFETIFFGSVSTTGSFDPTDDTFFNLIVGEYMQPACGVSAPLTTEFNLTKQP
ncbi:hypothetical protein [Mesohalobacter halotolerans]|uniref:Lipoprotein n=1 Tax=Mesohalobacter halotolerans TaxID=1883405 RepID=A0A4U5TTD4_9FLAO|nr:hypothetical protein [Mesohalobacter halotolerans]TKS57627.1 hypothetical protein FCN74_04215 [Mesohalobacter halotolerans]